MTELAQRTGASAPSAAAAVRRLQKVVVLPGQTAAAVGSSQSRGPLHRVVGAIVAFAILGGLWQAIVSIFSFKPTLLPGPRLVFDAFTTNFVALAHNAKPTTYEAVLGFVIAAALAIPLGLVLSRPNRIATTIQTTVLSAQVFPKIALAPLLVVWFGFGYLPKILFVILLTFFPITLNAMAGFKSTPLEVRNLGRVFGMGSFERFRHIEGPWALPQIFAGLKISGSFAIIAAIVSEFVAANAGLGFVIEGTTQTLNTALMFAALFCVAILGFAFYGLIAGIERIFVPWHVSRR